VRRSIWYVKSMYCVCLNVLEIMPSPQQMVMWGVWICRRVQEYWTSQILTYNNPINVPHYSVDNSRFWCQIFSVVHKRFRFKLSICRPNLYWPMSLVSCTVVSLKRPTLNCLDNIYINFNIGCSNETIKFVITTKFLDVQIDNNLTW